MPGRETLVYSAPRAASSPDDRPMFPPGSMTVSASGIFKILFWIHQVLLRVPAATIGLDLVSRGQTEGILAENRTPTRVDWWHADVGIRSPNPSKAQSFQITEPAHDKAGVQFLDRPGRRESGATSCGVVGGRDAGHGTRSFNILLSAELH